MSPTLLEAPVAERGTSRQSAIHLEGGLFGPDFWERLKSGDLPGQRPKDFGLQRERSVLDRVAEVYRDARDLWRVFRRGLQGLPERETGTSLTRARWVIPFLDLLGYNLVRNERALEVDGTRYAISHRAGENEDAPPVHIVGARLELGRKPRRGMSPHALLQEYLNRSGHLWGIVTNGRVLRLLRQTGFLRRQAYVEFDLEAIFEAEADAHFADFVLLFRLLHRSRLPRGMADAHECLLERYYQEALEQGNRARERLREGVEKCIKILGTGFLRANGRLPYEEHEDPAKAFYRDLLHLVYRFLFLLVAEERGLLGGNRLYWEHYSIRRLRRLADRLEARTEHEDLWNGLKALWYILREGSPQQQLGGKPLASVLGLPVLDGELFKRIPLDDLALRNRDLLDAFWHLSYYEDRETGAITRVNYAALDVEELGSVYESLLDNHPVIKGSGPNSELAFLPGTERKSTGSYYTPPELVQELVKSALEPVLEERLRHCRTPEEKRKAILSIRVLDPACGSGHFLLAAARRLARELARVESGEEEPSPEAEREARRKVIAHCIYGVDKNPLAVELCKVALWIESCAPGKPLTFLDHRIRCGDSLVGVFNLEVLSAGIPDAAFEPSSREDRETARILRQRNARERKGQMALEYERMQSDLRATIQEARQLDAMADDTIGQLEEKARFYRRLQTSQGGLRVACDLWTAAFFQDLRSTEHAITTDALRRALRGQPAEPRVLALAKSLSHKYRFFHWPLEFPHVFDDGGFDVVLGNPPFMGGLKISGAFGARYREWLEYAYRPFRGTADLCAAFYRRAFDLIRPGGRFGMVATNTIGQGDTRESGLAPIVREGGAIIFARRFIAWPGSANVEVNLVAVHKESGSTSRTRLQAILDGRRVRFISSRLDTEPEEEPKRLKRNADKAFQGDIVRGIGFLVDEAKAKALIEKDPRNADCLYPYLNGDDLNSHPEQKPSRWVICFHDWPLEVAAQYPDLLRIVEERVKSYRQSLRGRGDRRNREYWWQFGAYRIKMRKAIAHLRRVLVRSRVSELNALVFVPNDRIFGDATVVFAFDDHYHFAVLQSSLHESWLRRQASRLRTDVRYTPTDCFQTFPFPPEEYRRLERGERNRETWSHPFRHAEGLGEIYHEHRRQLMMGYQVGLTEIYKYFHEPSCQLRRVERLRELHAKMDHAVLACYGWQDIQLDHDFRPNERGQVRFMPSPEAQKEMLRRLLELNLRLAREEA